MTGGETRFPSLLMAWRNLWRHRLRTILAALGIMVGVVAIAGLGIAGSTIRYSATQQFDDLTNRATISPGEDADGERLSPSQVKRIRMIAGEATVIPTKRSYLTVAPTDRPSHTGRSGGGSPRRGELPREKRIAVRGGEVQPESPPSGEIRTGVVQLSNPDSLYTAKQDRIPDPFRTGVLLGNDTAHRLNVTVGDLVVVGDHSYVVRAVLNETGYRGPPSSVVVSPPAISTRGYSNVMIIAEDGDAAQRIANGTERAFNDDGEQVVRTSSYADLNQRVGSLFNTLNLILFGIGSISLFVAGVSILNVMLMSIVERRAEIGVLRSVGIQRGEILRMILSEALLLGVLGGLVGAALSAGIGALLYDVIHDDATIFLRWRSLRYLVVGFGFAVFASTLSGIYPAWKAARESPVEALRG